MAFSLLHNKTMNSAAKASSGFSFFAGKVKPRSQFYSGKGFERLELEFILPYQAIRYFGIEIYALICIPVLFP